MIFKRQVSTTNLSTVFFCLLFYPKEASFSSPGSVFPDVAALSIPTSASGSTSIITSSIGGASIDDFIEPAISREEIVHDFISRSKHPSASREIHVEDFLWTGSGDGDFDEYEDHGESPNKVDVQFVPTTLVVTSTIFIQPTASVSVPHLSTVPPDGGPIQPSSDGGNVPQHVKPTPVLPPGAYTSPPPSYPTGQPGFDSLESDDPLKSASLPQEEYLVRTVVLSNLTIIHNKIESFKHQMEEKLTKAFTRGLLRDSGKKKRRNPIEDETIPHTGRQIRSAEEIEKVMQDVEQSIETTTQQTQPQPQRTAATRVQIHNIRSSLPRPEIEMIYTVYQDDGEPMAATDAVEVLETVRDDDVENLLGFPLLTKAEPYTARPQALIERDASSQANLMIAVVIVSAFLVVVIALALLFLLYRAKNGDISLKHKRFLGSPTVSDSRNPSQAGMHHDGSSTHTLDRGAFTLERPHSKQSTCVRVSSDIEDDPKPIRHAGSDTSRSPSTGARATAGGESPTMADLSSNNTPETSQKIKKLNTRRQKQKKIDDSSKFRRELTPTGYSSGGDLSQSAFPLHTPDKAGWLGPLTDLLEEEIILPGESRDNSASVVRGGADKAKNWAYLPPRSPTTSTTSSSDSYKDEGIRDSPPWRHEAMQTRRLASQYKKTLNQTFPKDEAEEDNEEDQEDKDDENDADGTRLSPPDAKQRALSAKSHIFRKGKIESKLAKMGKNRRTRPWSAHESRISADPVFHMRQRHWEGLIAGKKHLHRGQLLPGSTSSEEDPSLIGVGPGPPPTCWSECSSPRKQVRISELPLRRRVTAGTSDSPTPVPLIQAIKDELQKFHRGPNLTGISIINDPDLLQKESTT